jgi:hypothetical protein
MVAARSLAATTIAILGVAASFVGPGQVVAGAASPIKSSTNVRLTTSPETGTLAGKSPAPGTSSGPWSPQKAAIERPRGIIPHVKQGQTLPAPPPRKGVSKNANPNCPGCNPPLLFTRGSPVMGGRTGTPPGNITITPVYWAPAGHAFNASYKSIINTYIANVAAASGRTDNVFSIATQYYQQALPAGSFFPHIQYVITAGAEVDDTTPYPAQNLGPGCTATSPNTDCIDDAALQSELQAKLTALSLPIDDAHLYMVMFPSLVETCQGPGMAPGTACSSNVYCAYHSGLVVGGNVMVYGNEPYPVLNGCTNPSNGPQAPNGDTFADAEISPFSHEASESITDYNGAWFDVAGFENGDECAYTYGVPLGGVAGTFYNQVINGAHYYTQDEFSNNDFALGIGDVNWVGGTIAPSTVAGCFQRDAWAASYSVGATPTTWGNGQPQTYSVTVTNAGTQTWPHLGGNAVNLSVHFANVGGGYGSNNWSTDQRFSLPADLAPGASVLLSLTVTAPAVGNVVVEYQMVKTVQFWFSYFADVNVSVMPAWVASYSVGATPTTWTSNQTQAYSITVTNAGGQLWPSTGINAVRLSVHFANIGGGNGVNNWFNDQRVSLPADLAAGASVPLNLSVTAPPNTGNLVLEYQVVKTLQFWFGQFSDVSVSVKDPWVASYSVGATPTTWVHNQTLTYTITVTNSGSQTWVSGGANPVRVSVHFANGTGSNGSSLWYTDQRISLPADLAPGASVPLTISITAPANTGSLKLGYEVVTTGQFWFFQVADVSVTVT